MKNLCLFTVLSFINLVLCEEKFETPEYILPCRKSDPEINKCLVGTFNHLRPYLVAGLNDIQVPSIDPLLINKINIENGNGPFKIRAFFNNVTVKGPSNYSVAEINADLEKYILDIRFTLPRIEIRGKYEVGGTVLLFPIRSEGDFWAVFVDVDAKAKIFGKEVKNKSDVKYMKIDRMLVDFNVTDSKFKIKDVVNLGNLIGAAINQFLNTNGEEIIQEMKPAASLSIARHFKAFLNSAFLKVPIKVWLPDA